MQLLGLATMDSNALAFKNWVKDEGAYFVHALEDFRDKRIGETLHDAICTCHGGSRKITSSDQPCRL